MSPRPRVGTVFFDLFGTLLDLVPLAAACDAVAPGAGDRLAATWRARQLEFSWLRTSMGSDAFVDFDQVTTDALRAALDELREDGVEVHAAADDRLLDAFAQLPLSQNSLDAIHALRGAGLRTGVLTNGARGTLERVLVQTGLSELIDFALSADSVRVFKPHPAVYRLATEASGLPASRVALVTANGWDAAGAGAFGLRAVWLRPTSGARFPRIGAPQPTVADWASLAATLLGV